MSMVCARSFDGVNTDILMPSVSHIHVGRLPYSFMKHGLLSGSKLEESDRAYMQA